MQCICLVFFCILHKNDKHRGIRTLRRKKEVQLTVSKGQAVSGTPWSGQVVKCMWMISLSSLVSVLRSIRCRMSKSSTVCSFSRLTRYFLKSDKTAS